MRDILRNTGIHEPDLIRRDIKIHSWQYHQLLLNAFEYAPDHSFGAQLGEQDFINNDSLLACRVMSCADANEGMRLLTNYYKLWTNQFDLCFEVGERWGIFSIKPQIDFGPTLPFYIEYLYSVLYSFGCFCLGEKSVPLIFEFSYAKPENSAHYERYFSNSARFNQQENRVLLPKSLLTRQLVFSNPELAQANDANVQDIMQNMHAKDIVSRTRALIQRSALNAVKLETIAAELCMSSRSLRRHLQNEGKSFQMLVEEQRRNEAKNLLVHTQRTIQEIATQLGYNDSSSFSRAFKRWENISPRDYQLQSSSQT